MLKRLWIIATVLVLMGSSSGTSQAKAQLILPSPAFADSNGSLIRGINSLSGFSPLRGVVAIAAGGTHSCALIAAGGLKCWGHIVGDGSSTDRNTVVDVIGLSSEVTAMATGGYHSCALTSGGGVKCWGDNDSGQLGDGSTTDRLPPVDVSRLSSGVIAVAAGVRHTCVLVTGGGVKCWGYNEFGQLGDGTTTNRLAPIDVVNLSSGVSSIAAGGGHTCALTSSGGVKCWGFNGFGQLGDGTTIQRKTPVDVSGLASSVSKIATGGDHTCAAIAGGGAKCWGDNWYGELGDGTTTNRNTPVDVLVEGVDLFLPLVER